MLAIKNRAINRQIDITQLKLIYSLFSLYDPHQTIIPAVYILQAWYMDVYWNLEDATEALGQI